MTAPNSSEGGMPTAPVVNGTRLALLVFFLLGCITVFTWYAVPQFVIPYYKEKPGQAITFLNNVEAALQAYHVDHGAFPPEDTLADYRRWNKNLVKSRAFGVTTYKLSVLTTPVAYLNPNMLGDPYAMPEQFAPPSYFTVNGPDGMIAVVASPGPNLKYNVRPLEVKRDLSAEALTAVLATRTYDPTNGTRSWGDIVRIVKPTK